MYKSFYLVNGDNTVALSDLLNWKENNHNKLYFCAL